MKRWVWLVGWLGWGAGGCLLLPYTSFNVSVLAPLSLDCLWTMFQGVLCCPTFHVRSSWSLDSAFGNYGHYLLGVSTTPHTLPALVSGQCSWLSLGVLACCSPVLLNQCNHTDSPTARTLTLRCTLSFALHDAIFSFNSHWCSVHSASQFPHFIQILISWYLRCYTISAAPALLSFQFLTKTLPEVWSPPLAPSRHLSCLKLNVDSLNRRRCHSRSNWRNKKKKKDLGWMFGHPNN